MENNYMSTWKKSSIRIGTPTNLIAALTAFLPVLYLCMKYSCWPPHRNRSRSMGHGYCIL